MMIVTVPPTFRLDVTALFDEPTVTAQEHSAFVAKISVPVVVMTILFVGISAVSSVCVNTTLVGTAPAA
jgi:hypothetical protein